jgi:shikimate dehydrogenase
MGRKLKKLYAVLGDPIAHSMSPQMHNDLFAHYQIDAYYLPFKVSQEDLADAVKGLRALGAAGFNVTIPHKSAIIPLLDEVDELALSIGAVNTVVNEGGRLTGYNTDGLGFLTGLEPYLRSIAGKKVLIIGAGGAARAIYFTLAHHQPGKIDIANRTVGKAASLIKECPISLFSNAYTLEEVEQYLPEYDLIIQTTMIGMAPHIAQQPLQLSGLKLNVHVCDIIYNPLETQFLHHAKEMGATIQNGLDMFVYQGALAFEKWTGINPDADRIKKIVLNQLGGKKC